MASRFGAVLVVLAWPALASARVAPAASTTLAQQAKACIGAAVADSKATLPTAEHGVAAARAAGDHDAESRFLLCEGYARDSLGDTGTAAARYDAAVAAAEAGGERGTLSDALLLRGQMRQFDGQYDAALDDLKRSQDIARAMGSETTQRQVLGAMANLYADPNVGEYDKAIGYYRELLVLNEKAGKRDEQATDLFNLGATYDSKGDYAGSLAQYRRALELYRQLDDRESVAEARRVIGAVLAKQGRAAEAIRWIDQALAYYQGTGNADGVARVRLTRGIALRAKGDPASALPDLQAAHAHFQAEGNRRFLARIDGERALAEADLGQWREAYAALRQQFDSQHALDRDLAENRAAQLRVQFDAERIEQANRVLQAENASRGAALRAGARVRRAQWLALASGALLLALLAALALRELRRARRLRILAMTDELTGVANRRSILAFLGDRLDAARGHGGEVSVVSFDIDHFKRINDDFGHDAGDRALRHVVAAVAQALRSSDRLGRVGGEEFLAVLPGTAADVAIEIAERARRKVEAESFDDAAPGLRLTISLGVAAMDDACAHVEALAKRADEALYRAKHAGRNRVSR